MQLDAIAGLHVARHGLVADARVAQFLLGIVGIHPEDVQRDLAVDGNRLDALDDGVPSTFQHAKRELTTAPRKRRGYHGTRRPIPGVIMKFRNPRRWSTLACAIALVLAGSGAA